MRTLVFSLALYAVLLSAVIFSREKPLIRDYQAFQVAEAARQDAERAAKLARKSAETVRHTAYAQQQVADALALFTGFTVDQSIEPSLPPLDTSVPVESPGDSLLSYVAMSACNPRIGRCL